jgi:hypothetical protein
VLQQITEPLLGMLALPTPVSGGSVDQLRPFLNVDDNFWRLVIAWLIATFRPRGPYPILAHFAKQGSGKALSVASFACWSIRTQPRCGPSSETAAT